MKAKFSRRNTAAATTAVFASDGTVQSQSKSKSKSKSKAVANAKHAKSLVASAARSSANTVGNNKLRLRQALSRAPARRRGGGGGGSSSSKSQTEKDSVMRARADALESRTAAMANCNVPAYTLRISNVVCTAWTGKPVSLRLVQLITQGRFDLAIFPSSVSRARKPTTTNSLFDTGRILVTGAPSVDTALYACTLFVHKLNRDMTDAAGRGPDLQVLNFKVQNIVSSFSLGYRLNIELFYKDQIVTRLGHCNYEPSLFRGCSWRRTSGLVFVLFSSGRVVLTGARNWEDAWMEYNNSLHIFERYKLGSEYTLDKATKSIEN